MDTPLSSESDCKCCRQQAEKKQILEAANTDSDGDFEDPTPGELEDDAFYKDGFHAMTKEEKRRYAKQIAESEGFDVDDFSDVFTMGLILPGDLPHQYERYKRFTIAAINQYNLNKNEQQLELVRVVKANVQVGFPMTYYITFEANAVGDIEIKAYQALVEQELSKVEVVFCRPKPTLVKLTTIANHQN